MVPVQAPCKTATREIITERASGAQADIQAERAPALPPLLHRITAQGLARCKTAIHEAPKAAITPQLLINIKAIPRELVQARIKAAPR
jgi:hypothetical protein